MNTSGAAPDYRNEPLDELFGSVFDLAGQITSRITGNEIEARLRRTLREADRHTLTRPVDSSATTTLVSRATMGDEAAWNQIVERYAPLVYRICQRFRLAGHDVEDVGQRVWLLLVEDIGRLREPAALPGWLATTTARECVRVLRSAQPDPPPENWARLADDTAIDAEILATERNAALHTALTALPPSCQELLALLLNDPPLSYAEISARLGIPVGSIGPQRRRCLQQLRRSIPPAALRGVREFNPGPPSAPRRPPLPE